MTQNNNSKTNIQEIEQQSQKDYRIMNKMKTLHKKIINNHFITEFDLFSIPVKLNINGKQEYQTFFGGLMHLFLIAICLGLTISIIYPNGIEFNSEITQTKITKDYGDTGQTLFDYTDQPVGFRGLKKNGTIYSLSPLTGIATFYAYQVNSDGSKYPLQVSSACQGGFQFCIRKSQINKQAKIYGTPSNAGSFFTYISYEVIWCDSLNLTCPLSNQYYIQISLSNFYKQKGGKVTQYKIKNNLLVSNLKYDYNVTRQIYTSNTKFFGHMSNVFSFDLQTYRYSQFPKKAAITTVALLTPGNYTTTKYLQIRNIPIGQTFLIKQNFDDFGQTLLFFLSVKQTFYFIIFIIFIRQYNKNSGYLEIADSLYYIDDPKTKRKYDFKRGYEVFFACLLHNHFLSKIMNFFFAKFGKTLHDYLPNKSICAISLINKAEQLLQENVFYGNLNDLSMMESQAPKKVPLIFRQTQQQEKQETQLSYFPFLPTDNEEKRKEKQIKKQAFDQFCEANQYISAKRKNHIYKVLTNNKLKYILAHQMQKQFKSFVRNVRIQMSENIYEQLSQNQPSEIKVGLNEQSMMLNDQSQNPMTAQNFFKH